MFVLPEPYNIKPASPSGHLNIGKNPCRIYVQTLNNLIQLWSLQPEISQPEMAHKATLDLLDIYAIT